MIHRKKNERWQIKADKSGYLAVANVLSGSKVNCTAIWITKMRKFHGNRLEVQ